MELLVCIVTIDESMVSFHTPEMKQQSKQWMKKGQPGPIKAMAPAIRNKQMVLAFIDSKGFIYTNYFPRGKKVNADHIVEALSQFQVIFKKKRPKMTAREWFFD